jgi:hypothetical protein
MPNHDHDTSRHPQSMRKRRQKFRNGTANPQTSESRSSDQEKGENHGGVFGPRAGHSRMSGAE